MKVFKHLDDYIEDFREPTGLIKKWGTINYNYFPNIPFDDIFILKNIYSKKKYVSGSKDTIKISRSNGNNKIGDFVGTQSPRLQFVCDMIDPEQPYLIIAGGNGGSPIQMYYNNLMDKFENGKLIQFKNIDFDDENNKKRIVSLEKKLFQ